MGMSKLKVQPLADRVLLEESKGDTKTAAGIILPDSAASSDDEMRRGKVVAVGPGRIVDGKAVAVAVKKDDEVLFKKWADKVKLEDEEYYLASESDLVAVIN